MFSGHKKKVKSKNSWHLKIDFVKTDKSPVWMGYLGMGRNFIYGVSSAMASVDEYLSEQPSKFWCDLPTRFNTQMYNFLLLGI